MRVAIPVIDQDNISPHFRRALYFLFIEIDTDKKEIKDKKLIPNPGHKPGAIPEFIKEINAQAIIVKGIGVKALAIFNEYGISVYKTSVDSVEETLKMFCENKLQKLTEQECCCGKDHHHEGEDKRC